MKIQNSLLKGLLVSSVILSGVTNVLAKKKSPLVYPYYDIKKMKAGDESTYNDMMVLNSGIASLQIRLDMIRRAQKSIEVEYFIYSTDMAGKILTRELVKAARRGVKVRILVDKSIAVFVFNEFYAKELAKENVELRFYHDAGIKPSSSQFRSHRKLFVIDDKEAITGGRNIGDDYFDLSDKFNFLDRDVYVKGSIVKTMKDSFDKYWEHKISERPTHPKRPSEKVRKIRTNRRGIKVGLLKDNVVEIKKYERATKAAVDFLKETPEELEIRAKVEEISRPILNAKKTYLCPETTYAADVPGANFEERIDSDFSDKYRVLRKVFFNKVSNIKKEILISSPYFINNDETYSLMNDLLDKKIDMTIYTNSLASTDAIYVAANFYKSVHKWQADGIKPYVHSGDFIPEHKTISPGVKTAKWGTHSKTQIYDNDEVMIGTYNIDNRSNFYNSEMGLFCKGNKDLTLEVRDNIESRMHEGYKIVADKKAVDKDGNKKSVYGDASKSSKIIMAVIALPSWLLKFLL